MKTDPERAISTPNHPSNRRWLVVLVLMLAMLTDGIVAGAVALRRDFIPVDSVVNVFYAAAVFLILAVLVLGFLLWRLRMGPRWSAVGGVVFLLAAGGVFQTGRGPCNVPQCFQPLGGPKVPTPWVAVTLVILVSLLLVWAFTGGKQTLRGWVTVALSFVFMTSGVTFAVVQFTSRHPGPVFMGEASTTVEQIRAHDLPVLMLLKVEMKDACTGKTKPISLQQVSASYDWKIATLRFSHGLMLRESAVGNDFKLEDARVSQKFAARRDKMLRERGVIFPRENGIVRGRFAHLRLDEIYQSDLKPPCGEPLRHVSWVERGSLIEIHGYLSWESLAKLAKSARFVP